MPPPDLDRLRKLLAEAGITAEVVAEEIDLPDGQEHLGKAAEAALAEALWAVVVDAPDLRRAVAVAVEAGIRIPVAVWGEGTPDRVLGWLEHPLEVEGGSLPPSTSIRWRTALGAASTRTGFAGAPR